MEYFVVILSILRAHRTLTLIGGLVAIGLLGLFSKKKKAFRFFPLVMFFGMANVFLSQYWVDPLVYHFGKTGNAVVTHQEATNSRYNHRTVIRYYTLIKTEDGKTIETNFESWDFNIYPKPDDGYRYPNTGEKFVVRYLASYPDAFVIVADGESAYSRKNECLDIVAKMHAAQEKMKFDTQNAKFKAEFEKYSNRFESFDCQNAFSSSYQGHSHNGSTTKSKKSLRYSSH